MQRVNWGGHGGPPYKSTTELCFVGAALCGRPIVLPIYAQNWLKASYTLPVTTVIQVKYLDFRMSTIFLSAKILAS